VPDVHVGFLHTRALGVHTFLKRLPHQSCSSAARNSRPPSSLRPPARGTTRQRAASPSRVAYAGRQCSRSCWYSAARAPVPRVLAPLDTSRNAGASCGAGACAAMRPAPRACARASRFSARCFAVAGAWAVCCTNPAAVNERCAHAPCARSATRRSVSRGRTRLKTFAARLIFWTLKGACHRMELTSAVRLTARRTGTGASTRTRWSKSSSSSGTSASG